jgi:GT2 family glycosyltransferase
MSKIGVVTVTYNSAGVLPEFFDSMRSQTHSDFILFLIDSGSKDGTRELVRGVADSRVQSVFVDKNIGFAAGSNLGIKMAREQGCEAILLLNNDTIFGPDLLQGLLDGLETHRCDMTTPKMLYYDEPNKIWAAGGHLNRWLAYRNVHDGQNKLDDGSFDEPRRVSFTPFCCVLMRSGVFDKLGSLDESYFVYTEDADYCLRAWRAGLSIWYVPEVELRHKVSSLTGHMSDFMVYHCTRNRIHYLRKHLPRHEAVIWYLIYHCRYTVDFLLRKSSRDRWKLRRASANKGWRVR